MAVIHGHTRSMRCILNVHGNLLDSQNNDGVRCICDNKKKTKFRTLTNGILSIINHQTYRQGCEGIQVTVRHQQ